MIVYTSVCGHNFDVRKQVDYPTCEFEAWTDKGHVPFTPWKVKPLAKFSDDERADRLNSKARKVLLLPDGASLYLDSTLTLKQDPIVLVEKYLADADIALFLHSDRDCAYQEMGACLGGKKDEPGLIESQRAYYEHCHFPKNYGLYWGGFLLRRNTPAIQALSLAWWEQIQWFSSRDQISLPYVLWKLNIKPKVIPHNMFSNPYVDVGR